MPGEDRKGPLGEGPRTGRGLGRCNNSTSDEKVTDQQNTTGNVGPGWGRGRGLGRGMGRGLGRGRGFGQGNR